MADLHYTKIFNIRIGVVHLMPFFYYLCLYIYPFLSNKFYTVIHKWSNSCKVKILPKFRFGTLRNENFLLSFRLKNP